MDAMRESAEKIQSDQLASVSTTFLRLRPKLLAPLGPVLILLLVGAGVPRTQLLAIAANFLVMLGFFCWEAWSLKRRTIAPRTFAGSLMITLVGLASVCGLSGGAESPFLPILFAPTGIAFAAFGSGRLTRNVALVFVLGVAYIGASHSLFPWPPIPAPHVHVMRLVATGLSTALLFFGVTGLASAYRETATALERMRFDVVEGAARRTSELQEFSAHLAHELKNPLASIKGLVQLVHDGVAKHRVGSEASDEAGRLQLRLGVVLSEVSRVESVLASSLTFVRPLFELRRKHQRVDTFLANFADLIGGQAQEGRVRVHVECAEITAEFDPDKLKQVLLNLAQNALYAMPRGGTLRLTGTLRTHDFVLEVNDDGIGMSNDDLLRVKEPYYSHRSGGTGLGVAIANGIVEQHGGTLSFESAVGIGTTARLVLPLALPHGAP